LLWLQVKLAAIGAFILRGSINAVSKVNYCGIIYAMKIFSSFVIFAVLFPVIAGWATVDAEEPRCDTWQGNDSTMAALVERPQDLINNAERTRGADLNFLADLRVAIEETGPASRTERSPTGNTNSAQINSERLGEAAPVKDDNSLVSSITDSLDSVTGGDGILGSLTGNSSGGGVLSNSDIGSGLRQALEIAAQHVVAQLGAVDGFNLDSLIHIPLPKSLNRVRDALEMVCMAGLLEDLELRLNRTAELATPRAKELFLAAIENMTLEDVRGILSGPDDAATQYFRRTM
jgi:hypothetical protein